MQKVDMRVGAVTALLTKLSSYAYENARKARYYDGTYRLKDLGISLPPNMRGIESVIGWPAAAVDVLEERLDFEGWSDEALADVYMSNDLDVRSSMAHADALIFGTSYITVTTGFDDEPDVVVSVASPREMVAERDRFNRVTRAAQFLTDEDEKLVGAVLFEPDRTSWLELVGNRWVVSREDVHNLGRVPVVQLINRPRASKTGGRSEITPAVMGYTDSALRTLVGAEVAREFYAVPQRYMMGAPESFFLDENGNPRGAWDAMMGKILAVEADEDGNTPTVGAFAANSMSPFFEQIRNLAQLLASETAIPQNYLGFDTTNPASADAIRMAENRLVKRAERRQSMFGKAWTEVARLVLMVRDGRRFADLTPDELAIRALWRDAATPTKSAAVDQVVKLNSIGVPFGEFTMKYLGLSSTDKDQLRKDLAKSTTGALQRITQGVTQAQQAPQAPPSTDQGV